MKSVYSAVRTGSLNKAFCIYLRTNSDLCHLQHKLIGFYNRDEVFTVRYELDLYIKQSDIRLKRVNLMQYPSFGRNEGN